MSKLNSITIKVIQNASWIVVGRIVNMIFSFFVSIFTAQFLGPSNYGIINYGVAYATFFYSVCTLGINSVLVKVLIDEKENEGAVLGTTLFLQGVSSVLSAFIIAGIVFIADTDEPTTIFVVIICSLGLPFRVYHSVKYWFQAYLLSKYYSIATTAAYMLTSVYRIILLANGASVLWFAFATALDHLLVSIILFVYYIKQKGPKLSLSKHFSKKILKLGAPFIMAGLMVSIYGNTDKFMLKQMMDSESVGYYSISINLCNAWSFILTAIIDSLLPVIMESRKSNLTLYVKQNRFLYFLVFYISSLPAFLFLFFGSFIVRKLYGEAYLPAVLPLQIVSWYVAFSYLGVARNVWIVGESLQKYIVPIYVGAAALNILLNFVFIPPMGASGAALASLITQIATVFLFPLFITQFRANTRMIVEGIVFKDIKEYISFIRQFIS